MKKQSDSLIYCDNFEDQFNIAKLSFLDQLIKKSLSDNLFPGAEILVFRTKNILYHKVFGQKQINPIDEPLLLNSIFDIASMTKPIITATLTMIFLEQGLLNLSDTVASYFHEFETNLKKDITLMHLLTHSSGLPAWENLYEGMKSKEESIQKLLNLPLEYAPGSQVVYSCMGFILLKMILEKISVQPLDILAKKYILEPLNMSDSYFNPDPNLFHRIPPTANNHFRGKILCGEVDDDNCYFFDGIGGNAGLFSTAFDVAIYSNMILQNGVYDKIRILSPKSVDLMIQNQTPGFLPRGLGFQLQDKTSPAGEFFGEHSFGHTGFTGTSFWLDPESKIGIIILTNRVHCSYRGTLKEMKSFRMKAHNIILASILH